MKDRCQVCDGPWHIVLMRVIQNWLTTPTGEIVFVERGDMVTFEQELICVRCHDWAKGILQW